MTCNYERKGYAFTNDKLVSYKGFENTKDYERNRSSFLWRPIKLKKYEVE